MIVTNKQLEALVAKYVEEKDCTTDEIGTFIDGLIAMMGLVTEIEINKTK